MRTQPRPYPLSHGHHARRITLLCVLLLYPLFAVIPSQAAVSRLRILAHGFGQPDDMAWASHGAIYFSDFGNSALNLLEPDGRRLVLRSGLHGPEGIMVEPDGTLILAEQVPNRLLHLDLRRGTTTVLATIPNPTKQAGVDGIALDPRDGSIIMPDSPSGRVLRVSLSGSVHVLAGGLGRPVGAIVLADGSAIVVDEHLNGAFRIGTGGGLQRFGGFLSVPDDILSDGHGGFYVTCLGDGTLRHLDATGAGTLVASGLHEPQGLLRRSDGSLIVTEESANRFVVIQP